MKFLHVWEHILGVSKYNSAHPRSTRNASKLDRECLYGHFRQKSSWGCFSIKVIHIMYWFKNNFMHPAYVWASRITKPDKFEAFFNLKAQKNSKSLYIKKIQLKPILLGSSKEITCLIVRANYLTPTLKDQIQSCELCESF